jgi:hypothetical protein
MDLCLPIDVPIDVPIDLPTYLGAYGSACQGLIHYRPICIRIDRGID